jgi:hypothetical protein
MSISYVPNVPLATNNPSVDQPNMETDTNAVLAWVAVDHVGFNVSSPEVSGQHLQVTFNSNNVPATPTSPPVLFTNTVGSSPQLFFYSGSTYNQYVNGTNGSTYLLGGLILKWGFSAVTGSSMSFTSLGIPAFPNAAYSMTVTGAATAYTGGFVVSALSSTAFTVSRTSGSGNTGYYFIAIGY